MPSSRLFYGLSFPLHRVNGRWCKAYSVSARCDEAYAIATSKDPRTLSAGRILWTQLGLHASWAVGALAGGLIGSTLLGGIEGLGFVLTALCVVLAIDAFRANPDRLTLVLAVGSAAPALAIAPGSMLLVAVSVFAASLVIRHRPHRGEEHGHRVLRVVGTRVVLVPLPPAVGRAVDRAIDARTQAARTHDLVYSSQPTTTSDGCPRTSCRLGGASTLAHAAENEFCRTQTEESRTARRWAFAEM